MTRLLCIPVLLLAGLAAPAAAPPARFDPLPAGARLRIGSARLHHGGLVRALAFAPPARGGAATLLASASHDQTVSLWHVPSGRELHRLHGHAADVLCLAFAPGGEVLASGGADGAVRLWAVRGPAAGRQLHHIPTKADSIETLAYDPSGKYLAVGGDDGVLRLYEASSRKVVRQMSQERAVRSLAWSGDGKWIAATGAKNSIVVWEAATGRPLRAFGDETVQCLAFAPRGALLVSREEGGVLRLWDASNGRLVRHFGGDDEGSGARSAIYQVAFANNGRDILVGTTSGTLEVWDSATGIRRRSLAAHRGRLTAVAVSGNLVATGGGDNAIRLHDLATGKALAPVSDPAVPMVELSAARDNSLLVLGPSGDVGRYDRGTGRPVPLRPVGAAVSAVVRPDGREAFLVDEQGKLVLVDLKTGKKKPSDSEQPLAALGLSADGKVLVTVGRAGLVTVRDGATGRRRRNVPRVERRARPVLSPDGSLCVLVGPTPTLTLFETATGRVRGLLAGHRGGALAAAFSHDSRVLASGGRDRMLRVWDVSTRLERRVPQPHAHWVCAVGFSPDGRLLASGTTGGLIQLWSAGSGKLLAEREGHRGAVTALTFPDRKTMVSAGLDASILTWDVAKVEEAGLPPLTLTPAQQDELWRKLREPDAITAALAMRRLARDARAAVALARAGVKPVNGVQIRKWLADLDDDDFQVRKRAFENLARLGRFAETPLRKELARKPGLDKHRRIEELLRKMEDDRAGGAHLQALRAVEVLEMVATPEARKLLAELAKGAAEADLTRQAKAALERLSQ